MKEYISYFGKQDVKKHLDQDATLFGNIRTIEEITESAHGSFVYVYSNEGPIPHFHVINKNKKFESCIRLDKAEYFTHGSKIGKLTSKEVKELIRFLNEKIDIGLDYNVPRYVAMCITWNNDMNNTTKVKASVKTMPDYNQLKKI